MRNTAVSLDAYVNVIREWCAYISWCCATACPKWTRSYLAMFAKTRVYCRYLCQCYTSVTCIHTFNLTLVLCYSMSKVNKFALSSVLENPVFECINTYVNSMLYRQVPLLRHIAICKVTSFCQCICVNYTWVICAHILMLCYSMSIVKVVPCTDILTLVYRTVPYQ